MDLSHMIGGLIGGAENSNILHCSSTVTIRRGKLDKNLENTTITGGLIGISKGSTLTDSFFNGSFKGRIVLLGGLVGTARDSKILNSYAVIRKIVPLHSGLVVSLDDSSIQNCFYITGLFNVHTSFLSTENSLIETSGKVDRKHRKNAEYYKKHGWDFENVWTIDKKINNGFPHLKANTSSI
jgi:hypothetical protein